MDRPVEPGLPPASPGLSPADARRNFACLVWKGSVFAMGWAEVMVVLQPLLVHFGASNTQIGLVQGVLAASLPGMLVSPWITRRFARKKLYLYLADSLYLLPIGLVGAAVWFRGGEWLGGPGPAGHAAMVTAIVWLMAAGQVAAGFGALPNQEFFASAIPMRLRGRLAGVSAGVGGLLGLAAAAIAAQILTSMPKPQGYGALLVLGWLLCQLADTAVWLVREPPTPVEHSPPPWSRAMWRAFFRDKPFLRVAICICLASPFLGQLAVFSSAFAFRELGFQAQMAAWLAMTASAARLALSPPAGWLTDRWGARPSLVFWTAAGAFGFLLLAVWPGTFSVFAAAGIAAVAFSGFSGAMNALTAGIPRPENRAGHFTLLGFCMVASHSAGPPAIGWIIDQTGYRTGFALLAAAATASALTTAILLRNLSPRAADYH